jgi:TonB-dependent Receptor Plug Domain
MIETSQSGLASSVQQTEVSELPMLNRSLSAMINLVPGAREVAITGPSSHGQGAMYVSFGGGAGRNNNMLVDGVDNKDEQDGGSVMNYSLEAIQEFRALTSTFPAEYGKTSVVVVLATKSGTNSIHGSGFFQGRNQSLIATDYFSKPENGGTGKPDFLRLQYGGSFGGPIKKDKVWYFRAAERVLQNYAVARSAYEYSHIHYLESFLPSVLDSHTVPQPSRDLLITGKVNFQPSQNQTFYVKYASQKGYVNNDFVGGGAAATLNGALLKDGAGNPVLNDQNQLHVETGSGGWTWVISPTAVNQFTAMYVYYLHDNVYPYGGAIPGAPGGCNGIIGVKRVPDVCIQQDLSFPNGLTSGYADAFHDYFNFEKKMQF